MHGSQYNICISILYVGHIFPQIPSNMILSSIKVRPSIYMACCMVVWGAVAILTALVKDYTGLVVVRFFLGFVEVPFYPGVLYIPLLFYTRKEIATRVSILYAGNIYAVAFAGLIAAATFATLDDKHGMHGWQWLFIIEGVVTIGVAVICIFILSDTPLTTRWLTSEQRQLAHHRIQRDTVGAETSKGARAGIIQALRDPRLYLLVFMQNMHLSATSFNQVCNILHEVL
jgi:MFS family permease